MSGAGPVSSLVVGAPVLVASPPVLDVPSPLIPDVVGGGPAVDDELSSGTVEPLDPAVVPVSPEPADVQWTRNRRIAGVSRGIAPSITPHFAPRGTFRRAAYPNAFVSSQPAPGAPAPLIAEVVVRYGDRVVDVRHVSGGRYVIGEGPDAHLTVPLPPDVDRAGVPLLIALADQAVLGLVPGMTGELVHADRTVQLADLLAEGRRSAALARGDRCELLLGALRFTITTVDPADYAPARRPVDRLYWSSNALSLLVIGALVLLGEPRPPGELALEEVTASRERAVRYLSNIPPPPPEPERPPNPPVQKTRSIARSIVKAFAEPPAPSPPPPSEPAAPLATPADPATAPTAARAGKRGISDKYDAARTAGVLGDPGFGESIARATASAQEGLLAYADDAESDAFWTGVARSGPRGPKFGGLDLAETERGGGAHGDKKLVTMTDGKRVTIDTTGGPGPTEEEKAMARRVVKIRYEAPSVQGGLEPMDVQSSLRKQDSALRDCYKKATGTENRDAHVVMRLKVNATGRVVAATLEYGSTGVEGIGPCLTAAAGAWKFDAPWDRQPATIVVEAALSSKSY
jgi:hypothetical protein